MGKAARSGPVQERTKEQRQLAGRIRRDLKSLGLAIAEGNDAELVLWIVNGQPRTWEPYTAQGLRSMLRRALDRAGVDGRGVSFHTLRHSFATRLVAAKVD